MLLMLHILTHARNNSLSIGMDRASLEIYVLLNKYIDHSKKQILLK